MNHTQAYVLLTHAAMHCKFGSEPTDRPATEADLQAFELLLKLRSQVAKEQGWKLYA
jgi:hypothetical protein